MHPPDGAGVIGRTVAAMRITVVASELPHPQGTAAGRDLYAWCEGLRALGHELDAWLWRISPVSPRGPIPAWCTVETFDVGPMWRAHLHALRWPRGDLARAGWRAPDDAVVVADHIWSFAGAAYSDRSVATFHFRTIADALASRRVEVSTMQMARAERIAGRRAKLVLAYSDRVGRHLRRPATFVPIALPRAVLSAASGRGSGGGHAGRLVVAAQRPGAATPPRGVADGARGAARRPGCSSPAAASTRSGWARFPASSSSGNSPTAPTFCRRRPWWPSRARRPRGPRSRSSRPGARVAGGHDPVGRRGHRARRGRRGRHGGPLRLPHRAHRGPARPGAPGGSRRRRPRRRCWPTTRARPPHGPASTPSARRSGPESPRPPSTPTARGWRGRTGPGRTPAQYDPAPCPPPGCATAGPPPGSGHRPWPAAWERRSDRSPLPPPLHGPPRGPRPPRTDRTGRPRAPRSGTGLAPGSGPARRPPRRRRPRPARR